MVASAIDRVRMTASPSILAFFIGAIIAAAVFAAPIGLHEAVVRALGIPALTPVAEPPLGMTARWLMGLTAGVLSGTVIWVGLHLSGFRPRRSGPRFIEDGIFEQVERRRPIISADSEPRRPIFAEVDLGEPFASVRAEPVDAEFTVIEDPFSHALQDYPILIGHNPEASECDISGIDTNEEIAEAWPVFAEPIKPASGLDIENLTALLHRFEVGLERKRLARVATVERLASLPPMAPEEAAQGGDGMDEALRDALGTLQRMTSRNR